MLSPWRCPSRCPAPHPQDEPRWPCGHVNSCVNMDSPTGRRVQKCNTPQDVQVHYTDVKSIQIYPEAASEILLSCCVTACFSLSKLLPYAASAFHHDITHVIMPDYYSYLSDNVCNFSKLNCLQQTTFTMISLT